MKVQKNIEVWLVKKRLPRPIDLVQYDTGIQLVFAVQDFTIPDGTTATMYVHKPSGKFVYQETGITVSGNTITIDLENQAITEHGNDVPYQVTMKNGTDLITTFAGIMRVEKSLKDAGATESESVIAAFEAKTAEQIAEIEAAAHAQIEVIRNLYTTYATKTDASNAVKGKLSGAVVAADDVSPLEHNPVVKVHGKNLIPYGTITFTRNQSCLLDNPLPAGTYTISAHIESSDTDSVYSAVSINSKSEVMKYLAPKRGNRVSSTFTVDKPITNIDFCSAYNYSQGEGDTATWSDIQLEEGSVSTDYEPYIDPSTVTVKRCGKNLLNLGDVRNGNGSTSKNENGKFTVTGYFASVNTTLLHSGERYTVSFSSTRTGEAGGGISVEFFDETDTRITGIYKQNELSATVSFTVPENTVETRFYFYGSGTSTGTDSATYTKMQVECGSDATPYEPYNGAEYTPAADGTVSGITSLSPSMTIMTDTDGAIVECEYNIDLMKFLKNHSGGMDLAKLTVEVTSVDGGNQLSLSDGTTTKTVLIPAAAVSAADIQAAVDNYLEANPVEVDAYSKTETDNLLSKYALKTSIPTVPTTLPNPHALTINGTAYDGSAAVDVTVGGGEGGGGSEYDVDLLMDETITEEVTNVIRTLETPHLYKAFYMEVSLAASTANTSWQALYMVVNYTGQYGSNLVSQIANFFPSNGTGAFGGAMSVVLGTQTANFSTMAANLSYLDSPKFWGWKLRDTGIDLLSTPITSVQVCSQNWKGTFGVGSTIKVYGVRA